MRTKPTTVEPIVAFRSKHEQLRDVDCPDCLIRMYQTAIANPFVGGSAQT